MRVNFILKIYLISLLIIANIQAQVDFSANQTEGCTVMRVKFTPDFDSVNPATISSIKWHFGYGDTIVSLNPDTVNYTQMGQYTVVMIINNQTGNAVVKNNYITVHPTVNAFFETELLDASSGTFTYRFLPTSQIIDHNATYSYTWQYTNTENGIMNTETHIVDYSNPSLAVGSFAFDTGIYRINLQVTDNYGCASSYERALTLAGEITPIPNVFVPEVHKFFIIDPQDISIVLSFKLFNRNGMVLFQQEAPIINWDGKSSSGYDLNTGVYFYILEATQGDYLGRYNKKGFIHLYR